LNSYFNISNLEHGAAHTLPRAPATISYRDSVRYPYVTTALTQRVNNVDATRQRCLLPTRYVILELVLEYIYTLVTEILFIDV
jgi:hypothetical protein